MLLRSSYAMPGTDVANGTDRDGEGISRLIAWYESSLTMVLGLCYALFSTESCYAATRRSLMREEHLHWQVLVLALVAILL